MTVQCIPGFSRYTLQRLDDGDWLVVGPRGSTKGSLKDGRWHLCLTSDSGRRAVMQVGRIVLLAHVGEPPNGTECCHRDGDSTNNDPSNLYWGTRSQNVLDMVRHGTHNKIKLSDADRAAIVAEWNPNLKGIPKGHPRGVTIPGSQKSLAKKWGVNVTVIGKITRGSRL